MVVDTLHNIGGTIDGIGKGVIEVKTTKIRTLPLQQNVLALKLKKGLSGASNDAMLTEQEDQILITDKIIVSMVKYLKSLNLLL